MEITPKSIIGKIENQARPGHHSGGGGGSLNTSEKAIPKKKKESDQQRHSETVGIEICRVWPTKGGNRVPRATHRPVSSVSQIPR